MGRAAKNVQRQIGKAGVVNRVGHADLSILREPILVISQKGKLVEMRAEYAIYDQHGRQLAAVRGKRISTRLTLVDMNGLLLIDLRREASLVSAKITVSDANGVRVGRIVPSASWKHPDRDFKLEAANDQLIGEVYGEDVRRHREFNVQDGDHTVVARITKTRAGLAKEMFTKGDDYVLNFSGRLTDQLRLLSVATALVIDTRFHQG